MCVARIIGAGGLALSLAAILTGCTLFRPPPRVSVEADASLSRTMERNLLLLASVEDVLEDDTINEELLRLATRADQQNMNAFLRTQGYYDAAVRSMLVERRGRPHVRFEITFGPEYHMLEPEVTGLEEVDAASLAHIHQVSASGPRRSGSTAQGKTRASSAALLGMRAQIIRALRETGYPYARVTHQEVVVDHATRLVTATFTFDPGPFARFGTLRTEGLVRLRETYPRRAQTWAEGETFDVRKIETMERRLASGGLFSSIRLHRDDPAEPPEKSEGNADERPAEPGDLERDEIRYDVRLTLRERRPRTVQIGVGYRTDTGAETSAQWQDRNLFGGGENLMLRGRVNEDGHEVELRLTVPFFRRPDQQWGSSVKYRTEETDAYDSRGIEGETWIARELTETLIIRSGVALYYLDETQLGVRQDFLLLSLPQRLFWDRSNDRLDATRGHRIFVLTEPFQGLNDVGLFFWKNQVTMSGFLPLRRDEALSFAARLTAGSISGDSLKDIPAESRFYAGGGQSVRGYAYQSISPRDAEGEITGGMSLLESSVELRARMGESLGGVVFLDGGAAFESRIADFEETYQWGAGAGFRYFTPVGPLRFDAGFPLNRREDIDKRWQFYISIGQAF